MTWQALFGPLLRALTPDRPVRVSRVGRHWDGLLAQLGLPGRTFDELLASGSLHPHFHYRHFTKPKKDGGQREIVEPDVKLKRVQREVLARYLEAEPPHAAAVAYRRQKSIADHVWPHAGAEVLVTADVQDFFPSTHDWRVQDWWRERVDDNLARLLALLTTYRGGLPQGAPTSPALSNLVNRELDERLVHRADATGARYTRYCDDMVFSWGQWPGPPSDFESSVRGVLHEFGYTLHPEKGWRVHHRHDEPEITGLILTRRSRVRLPDVLRRLMRELSMSKDPHDLQRLVGYEGYEAMVTARPRRSSTPRERSEAPSRTPTRAVAPVMRMADNNEAEIPF